MGRSSKPKFDKYAPRIQKTMDRYAPTIREEAIDNRLAKYLFQFGLLFLVMEALLVVPGITMGIMMVKTWIYVFTGGLAAALLLGAGFVFSFQRAKKRKIMRYVAITMAVLLCAVIYFSVSLIFLYAGSDAGQGIYESPTKEHGLYVCRIDKTDDAGNITESFYRGYRCYGRQAYIYEENEVPAAEGFEVIWVDADTATLTSGENTVTIEFGVAE